MTDTRSSSALFKRAEQLKRWEESDTNKQSPLPKQASRIQFSSGIVFLAACTAGDKEEVQRLLKMGADINTANVDGLTALHQVSDAYVHSLCENMLVSLTRKSGKAALDIEGWISGFYGFLWRVTVDFSIFILTQFIQMPNVCFALATGWIVLCFED